MNAAVDDRTAQAAARQALIEELGLSMVATFVPFSESRHAKPNPTFHDLQINWRISWGINLPTWLHKLPYLTTDYSQGLAHVPGYQYGLRDSLYNFGRMYAAVQENIHFYPDSRPFRTKRIPPPKIEDVLYCLLADSDAIEYRDFADWANNYGYDLDSRKAEAIYQSCLTTGLSLRAVIGNRNLQRLHNAFQNF